MKYVQLKLGVLELGFIGGSHTSWNKNVEWQLNCIEMEIEMDVDNVDIEFLWTSNLLKLNIVQ